MFADISLHSACTHTRTRTPTCKHTRKHTRKHTLALTLSYACCRIFGWYVHSRFQADTLTPPSVSHTRTHAHTHTRCLLSVDISVHISLALTLPVSISFFANFKWDIRANTSMQILSKLLLQFGSFKGVKITPRKHLVRYTCNIRSECLNYNLSLQQI